MTVLGGAFWLTVERFVKMCTGARSKRYAQIWYKRASVQSTGELLPIPVSGPIFRAVVNKTKWEGSTTMVYTVYCRLAKFPSVMRRVNYSAVIG